MNRFKKKLKQLIFQNFLLKVGSFILAIMLWLFVQNQGKIEQKIYLNLDKSVFSNLPKDDIVNLYKVSTSSIEVVMKGLPSAMSSIDEEVQVSIPLQDDFSSWGANVTLELKNNNFTNVPLGVEILSIYPPSITFMLDYFMEKEVDVFIYYTGIPRKGYEIDKVTVSPEKVKLFGPRSIITDKERILTSRLNINDSYGSWPEENVALILPHADVDCFPKYVKVNIEIKEIIETREFQQQPLELKYFESKTTYEISASTVTVTLKGPQLVLDSLNKEPFRVIVDLQELPATNKWKTVKPQIQFPQNFASRVEILSIEPYEIQARVKALPQE